MNEQPVRVMLVDDQELIRTGFRLVLASEPQIDVVAEASDGAAALRELERLGGACDVVLMDVRMPGMNGIEASAAVARDFPHIRVLVLTTFDLDAYATAAIQAGASGFLLKDARPSELVDAIHRVHSGDAVMAPSVTKRLIAQLRESGDLAFRAGDTVAGEGAAANELPADPLSHAAPGISSGNGPGAGGAAGGMVADAATQLGLLTEREREVLQLIAEGQNNAEISATLFLSESTVKTHVGRVLSKLQLRDRVHAVIFARTAGL